MTNKKILQQNLQQRSSQPGKNEKHGPSFGESQLPSPHTSIVVVEKKVCNTHYLKRDNNSANVINSIHANQCTFVVVRSCQIYSLFLSDIASSVGNGSKGNGSYIFMMCTDVCNENLCLLGFQISESNAEFLKSILLPVPCRFCLFCNFGFFLVAIAKEFLESFPPHIKQQYLLQINSIL